MKSDNESKWSNYQREWKQSGLTKAAFCKQKGISISAFYAWGSKLSSVASLNHRVSKKTAIPKDVPQFVELQIPSVAYEKLDPPRFLRITTSYGSVVEIPL